MNTINELCLAWFMWVNSNYDVLIMTITLLVVGALVLEVIRLNKRAEDIEVRADWDIDNLNNESNYLRALLRDNVTDQINVNVHLAEDIAELQKRLKEVKTKRKSIRK